MIARSSFHWSWFSGRSCHRKRERRSTRERSASPMSRFSTLKGRSSQLSSARAVVSMGGYNTFCEILSLDKRSLLGPRSQPRREQLIRATRAAELGVVDVLEPALADDPQVMARALRRLPTRPLPSALGTPIDLGGLESVQEMVGAYLDGSVHSLKTSVAM